MAKKKTDITQLYKERKTRELTEREQAAVNFWEVCLQTEFKQSMYKFEIADMIETVLDSPKVFEQ